MAQSVTLVFVLAQVNGLAEKIIGAGIIALLAE